MPIGNVVVTVFGARSVSCHFACEDGDTLTFGVIRDALVRAGAVASLDIVQFLSTPRASAADTVVAIAQAGAIIDPIGAGTFVHRSISDANTIKFHSDCERVALRISLSSALSS